MKKLPTLAFYALMLPAITLSSGTVFAEVTDAGTGVDEVRESTEKDQDALVSNTDVMQTGEYMESVPANSMMATNLIGANVQTIDGDDVGSVSELIIAKNGQIVGVVVGVGGFLGLGEKDIAFGWDAIVKLGDADQQQLHIDVTRDDLLSAPEFVKQ